MRVKPILSYLLVPISTVGMLSVVSAQPEAIGGARYIDPVYPTLFDGDLRDLPRTPDWKPGDPIKEIPKRRKPPLGPLPEAPPEPRLDPLLEIQEEADQRSGARVFTTPLLNFAGQGFSGVNPPDTVGDIGGNYFIQMINAGAGTTFVVYNKSNGSIAAGPTVLDGLAGSGDCTNGHGDPIVLYDELADRWLLSEFASANDKLCVYVSQTADPIAGGWFSYEFATPDFPDYPKYSVWPDAYYVTSNESSPKVYALDRAQMLTGSPAAMQAFSAPNLSGFGFQVLTPADLDGSTPPPASSPAYFARHKDDEVHTVGAGTTLADGTGGLQTVSLDISGALGSSNVVVRFAFDTTDASFNAFEGFHIDDVEIAVDHTPILSNSFEDPTTVWTGTGLWHRSTSCSAGLPGHSNPTTWYYGQSGVCTYDTGVLNTGTLDSPVLDLSFGSVATLSFNYFLETEQFCSLADTATVQLSIDGGTTFTDVIGNCVSYGAFGGDPNTDVVELWELSVDWANPGNSSFTGPTEIVVSDFDSDLCGLTDFFCFPQPGSSVQLDPLREVTMWRLQYRNFGVHESLVGNFVTDATGTDVGGVRWFELRDSGGGWGLHQEGTYSPDNVNRWMGSIAMDGDGNIAVGYNVTDGASVFPGIRFTGRLAADTLGTMSRPETVLIAGSAANASNRYGDYSSMSVDPADDCTFWFTGEYNPGSTWSTRIGSFKFDSCLAPDPSCSGTDVTISGRTFAVDTKCVGSNSIAADGSTTVQAGASVRFVAPAITLGPDFDVAAGAVFRAGP